MLLVGAVLRAVPCYLDDEDGILKIRGLPHTPLTFEAPEQDKRKTICLWKIYQ
jgi:hypothetical protein